VEKEYDLNSLPDFITKDKLNELLPEALERFEGFVLGEGSEEEECFEIWVGDEAFVLSVWDEEGGDRSGRCSASLYRTIKNNLWEWRETDSSQYVTLFSWSK